MSATASRMALDAGAEGPTETAPQMHVDFTEGGAAAAPSRIDAPAEDSLADSSTSPPRESQGTTNHQPLTPGLATPLRTLAPQLASSTELIAVDGATHIASP